MYFRYVSDYNCTNTEMKDKLVESARKSFPSGHAAYAVYMALFLIVSTMPGPVLCTVTS